MSRTLTSEQRRWLALVLLAGVATACATSGELKPGDVARAAPPVEAGAEDQMRFAMLAGEASGVELTVMDRRWVSNTQGLTLQHTSLWVRLENRGDQAVRFRVEDLSLELEQEAVMAADIDRLVSQGRAGNLEEGRLAKTTGLKPATLEPGERAQGFVFFPHKLEAGRDDRVALKVVLYDPEHRESLEELSLPLELVK